MTVISGARCWGRSWRSRGAAIVAVLLALAGRATLGDRMGAVGSSWAVAATGRSEAREQRAAGSLRGRGPPATKAPVRSIPDGELTLRASMAPCEGGRRRSKGTRSLGLEPALPRRSIRHRRTAMHHLDPAVLTSPGVSAHIYVRVGYELGHLLRPAQTQSSP